MPPDNRGPGFPSKYAEEADPWSAPNTSAGYGSLGAVMTDPWFASGVNRDRGGTGGGLPFGGGNDFDVVNRAVDQLTVPQATYADINAINARIDRLIQSGALNNAPGAAETLRRLVTTPGGIARLAALVPALLSLRGGRGGGGGGPFGGGLEDELADALALQHNRALEAQPLIDTAQRMAWGSAPVRYRTEGPFDRARTSVVEAVRARMNRG